MTEQIHNYGYRTPRFEVDFRLLVQTDDRLPRLLDARCINLSEDGLAVETSEPLELDANVTLILSLPGLSNSIRIAAKVSNFHQQGYGFAFIYSSPSERKYICDFLASQH